MIQNHLGDAHVRAHESWQDPGLGWVSFAPMVFLFCPVMFLFLKSHNYSSGKTYSYVKKNKDGGTRGRRGGSILPKNSQSRTLNHQNIITILVVRDTPLTDCVRDLLR